MLMHSFVSIQVKLPLGAALAVAGLFVCLFGVSFPWDAANATHSQDATLSLYWMHRTHTVPYRDWFFDRSNGTSAAATHVASDAAYVAIPVETLAREGNVVLPLHAIYLFVLGHFVRQVTGVMRLHFPDTAAVLGRFWEPDFFDYVSTGDGTPGDPQALRAVSDTLFAVRWVSALVLAPLLFQLSAMMVWPLVRDVAGYLAIAAQQRQKALAVVTAKGQSSSAAAAAASAAPAATEGGYEMSFTSQQVQQRAQTVADWGFVVVYALVILPTMAVELTTLHPVCHCMCLLLHCVHLLFRDEDMLTSAATYHRSRFTNKESEKLFNQNTVFGFPMKQQPTLQILCQAAVFMTCMALSLGPATYCVAGLGAWLLTLCYQRVHRRVLVRVKVPDGVESREAAEDGFVDIGFSTYQDRLSGYLAACYVTTCILLVVAAVCAPFLVYRHDLFTFMNLFAPTFNPDRSYYHASSNSSGGGAGASLAPLSPASPTGGGHLSLTGGLEVHERCVDAVLALPHRFTCGQPVLSIFTISEFFGVPLTSLVVAVAGLFAPTEAAAYRDGVMWMQYFSVMATVIACAVAVIFVVAYRVRRPFTVFDAPADFYAEYALQKERFFAYWGVRADEMRRRKRYPAPAQPFVSAAAAAAVKEQSADVTKTCISQEEYVLKQLVGLLWVLVTLSLGMSLFHVRGGDAVGLATALLPPAGLLYAVHTMLHVVRRADPALFDPSRNRRTFDAAMTERLALQDLARQEREEREATKDSGDTEGAASTGGSERPPAAVEELQPIPAEHDGCRTFTSSGYSFTTPVFGADGTGWSLSSRWCSPAALGEHTDGVWSLAAVVVALAVCCQFYEAPPSAVAERGVRCVLSALLGFELARSQFWRRTDLLTGALLSCLQIGGAYAALQQFALAREEASSSSDPSLGTVGALRSWLASFGEAFTGPSALFDLQSGSTGGSPSRRVWNAMYLNAVLCLCLLAVGVHAALRLGRMMLESEEVVFVHPQKEVDAIYGAGQAKSKSPAPGR